MRLLLAYATTDGQTRKIARFAADVLSDAGHTVELMPVADAGEIDLGRFGGVILAGSIHAGGYQSALADFAHDHAAALQARPTLLLSVSLSAAGHNPKDWAGLDRILKEFTEATGWRPGRVEAVAGAFRFSEYDLFRAWIMRRIAAEKDPTADLHADKEYTDWPKLRRTVTDWAAGLASAAA